MKDQNPDNSKGYFFNLMLCFQDGSWEFSVRPLSAHASRFHAQVVSENDNKVEFEIVRSSIGRWIINGDNLPEGLKQYSQDIGKAFESHTCARLQN